MQRLTLCALIGCRLCSVIGQRIEIKLKHAYKPAHSIVYLYFHQCVKYCSVCRLPMVPHHKEENIAIYLCPSCSKTSNNCNTESTLELDVEIVIFHRSVDI